MTYATFNTRVRTIHRPDAFLILKELLRKTENHHAPPFLNACMRVGNKLRLPFPEGVILASYTIWLEENPHGNLGAFLGARDYTLVFGMYTEQRPGRQVAQ